MLTRQKLENSDDIVYTLVGELIRMVHAVSPEHQTQYVRSLTPGMRMVWGIFLLDGEVNNGGFNQYFWNDSHRFLQETVEGLELIDAEEQLRLLRTAISRFEAERERLRPYRDENTLRAFSDSYSLDLFSDLDTRYFQLDTYALQETYIRSHLDEFVTASQD